MERSNMERGDHSSRKRKDRATVSEDDQDIDLSLSLSPPLPLQERQDRIVPPYRWATNRRCKIQAFKALSKADITFIDGPVQCFNCKLKSTRSHNLLKHYREAVYYVLGGVLSSGPRSNIRPDNDCVRCNKQDGFRPLIPDKKRKIDWLFLLLGRFIECCTDSQLRYYCKHNNIRFHDGCIATASRHRLFLATYWSLCHQLDSGSGLFRSTLLPFSYHH